jgi:Tfp pilus assembly protein PilX
MRLTPTTLRSRLAARLGEERGMTMLLALFVLTITTLILGGTYMAVLNDSHLSRNDLDQKRAYAAAQAGVQAYNYQLNQDENYWQTCATLGTAASPLTVPGSTDTGGGKETYYVTPMAASTAPAADNHCDTTNALATMIEGSAAGSASGSFRIKSVGISGNPAVSRTIIAQYKPPSFLDFVYYTDYETLDPAALPGDPGDCQRHYTDSPGRGGDCGGAINFITGDTINGPLHSEDTLAICGTPVFGRTIADQIQAPGWANESGTRTCPTANPDFVGTDNTSATAIQPPPDNAELLTVTQSAYHFVGKTTIVLNGNTMNVTNALAGDNNTPVTWPSNGVIYVSTAPAGCGVTYDPFNPSYTTDSNCGNAYVSGNYTSSLTIATDNDIVINGSITTPVDSKGVPTTNALLGLIANDFVRIAHPVTGTATDVSTWCNSTQPGFGYNGDPASSVDNGSGALDDPKIYAAILAVNHSFIVDNYNCGGEDTSLGTLVVYGAIAQLFRGPVGAGGGSGGATNGYLKNYNYDDRLASEEPPYFLNPVSAQWFVSRETECDSASTC